MGDRLFTGSFDSTLKVWDASELFAEKSSGEAKKKRAVVDEDLQDADTPQKLTIENEKNFQSKNTMMGDDFQTESYDQYDSYDQHDAYDDQVGRDSYREQEMVWGAREFHITQSNNTFDSNILYLNPFFF